MRFILNNLEYVGQYNKKFNELLGIDIRQEDIYKSVGLETHMKKRNHFDCLKYIKDISDIIKNPDYIGINPNEKTQSVELIKIFDNNVLLGLKVDVSAKILYVSTMYSIQESKLQRRIHSGRLIKYEKTD